MLSFSTLVGKSVKVMILFMLTLFEIIRLFVLRGEN